jgi:LacI family transcriptional regulator
MTIEQVSTLSDVASLAGVSLATASRYMTNPLSVRATRRQSIEAAVQALGYVPNGAARALASRHSRIVGALFPSLDNVLFGSFIGPLQRALSAQGYTLVVASSDYDQQVEYRQMFNLVANGVDGVVLVGTEHTDVCYDLLTKKRIPYVLTWTWNEQADRPMIGFCNRSAAARVANYLLDVGHAAIAMISGYTTGNDRATERIAGVREAMSSRGVPLNDDWIVQRPFNLSEGAAAFRELMSMQSRPTAIICGSDLFACGAIFEAARMGIRIPEDVSITGFDDTDLAAGVTPSLTTIRTPRTEMATLTAEHLLDSFRGAEPRSLELKVELVVRESSGPPRRL